MGEVISIHGSCHRSGVTMIATSLSKVIAKEFPDKSVLFLGMCASACDDYAAPDARSIDSIRLHLENHLLKAEEIRMLARIKDNFYMLAGSRNVMNGRDYFPETSEYLISVIQGSFDFIICDTGNNLDDGLALGALLASNQRYCVVSQCESAVAGYEKNVWLYRKLEMDFDRILLNKFFPKDPYDKEYVAKRLMIDEDKLVNIRMAGYSRQAEMDRKTLMDYRNDAYISDISAFSSVVKASAGYMPDAGRKRRLWKTGSI